MATVFNRYFEFIRIEYDSSKFDDEGNPLSGEVQRRNVRGTVQPMTGKDAVPDAMASRNTGTAKVYSSERLDFRSMDGNTRGFVKLGDFTYELMDELPYQNLGPITHWKYIAKLVPPTLIEGDQETHNVIESENGDVITTENGDVIVAENEEMPF